MKTLLFAVGCLTCLSFTLAQQSEPPVAVAAPQAIEAATTPAGDSVPIYTRVFPGAAKTLRGFGKQAAATGNPTAATVATPVTAAPSWKYETLVWPVPQIHPGGAPSKVSKFHPLANYGDWEVVSAVSSTAEMTTAVLAGETDLKVPVPVIVYTLRKSQP